MSWPSSLPLALRPSELRLRTLRKSSRKPTAPQKTNRPSRTSAVMVGLAWAICRSGSVVRATCPATYAMTVATMNATPPIVGVPFLPWWLAGPEGPDRLAGLERGEHPDRHRRAEQRDDERDRGRDDDCPHGRTSRGRARAQRVGHVPRAVPRTLDQHHVAGAQVGPHDRDGGGLVGGEDRLARPAGDRRRPRPGSAAAFVGDRDQPVHAQLGGEPADLLVPGRLVLAQLGHVAEHRGACAGPAPIAASARSAAAVDDGLALYESSITVTPSGRSKTSIRRPETMPISPSAAARSSSGMPSSQRRPPPRRACCRPGAGRPRRAGPAPDRPRCQRVRRPGRGSSSVTSVARTVGVRRPRRPARTRAAVPRRHRGDQRIVGVEHRRRRPAGSASTSSPLASAVPSTEPNSPMCAAPTLSTTPIRGGAISAR